MKKFSLFSIMSVMILVLGMVLEGCGDGSGDGNNNNGDVVETNPDTGTTIFGLPYDERVESVNVNPVYGTSNIVHYSLTVSHDQALAEMTKRLGPSARGYVAASIPNYTQRNSTTIQIGNNIDDSLQRTNIYLLLYETRLITPWVIVGNGNQIIQENSTIFNCNYSYREIVTRDITMYLLTSSGTQALSELRSQFGEPDYDGEPFSDPSRPYYHSQLSVNNGNVPTGGSPLIEVDRSQNRVFLSLGWRIVIWNNVSL